MGRPRSKKKIEGFVLKFAMVARISRAIAGQIFRGDCEKVSTDRLLRIARWMGLKAKLKFEVES